MKSCTVLRADLFAIAAAGVLLTVVLLPGTVHARPAGQQLSRQKRVSDQRLAELETLLALARMRGKLVTVPVAFGKVDPAKIGRKRRSSVDTELQKLQRILIAVARESEVASEDSNGLFSTFWKDEDDQGDGETEERFV